MATKQLQEIPQRKRYAMTINRRNARSALGFTSHLPSRDKYGTFIVFVIDYLLCLRFPALDDTAANSLILDIFPIAGGAVGMLFALFLLGGPGRGRRMNKDNIAW